MPDQGEPIIEQALFSPLVLPEWLSIFLECVPLVTSTLLSHEARNYSYKFHSEPAEKGPCIIREDLVCVYFLSGTYCIEFLVVTQVRRKGRPQMGIYLLPSTTYRIVSIVRGDDPRFRSDQEIRNQLQLVAAKEEAFVRGRHRRF